MQEKIGLKVVEVAESPDPEQLGKPLQDELRGLFRLSFGRYRIIYGVRRQRTVNGRDVVHITVAVVLVGIRRDGGTNDIYRVATRLRRRGTL
ncbi:MAG TPA: hypothetical protein VK324_07010 [Tepidisphaeraceae bacterium]|nr:hypothetical protein [Tepidisphaeraceae bacterium]